MRAHSDKFRYLLNKDRCTPETKATWNEANEEMKPSLPGREEEPRESKLLDACARALKGPDAPDHLSVQLDYPDPKHIMENSKKIVLTFPSVKYQSEQHDIGALRRGGEAEEYWDKTGVRKGSGATITAEIQMTFEKTGDSINPYKLVSIASDSRSAMLIVGGHGYSNAMSMSNDDKDAETTRYLNAGKKHAPHAPAPRADEGKKITKGG